MVNAEIAQEDFRASLKDSLNRETQRIQRFTDQMLLLARLWKTLGIPGVELHVNSIADAADRKAHRDKLVAYFERHAAALDEDALRSYLREHLAPYKQPAVIRRVEHFPMTGSGKVLKRKLLETHPPGAAG